MPSLEYDKERSSLSNVAREVRFATEILVETNEKKKEPVWKKSMLRKVEGISELA